MSQAHKALNAHGKERDAWKAEADRAQAEARKLKDKLEESGCFTGVKTDYRVCAIT